MMEIFVCSIFAPIHSHHWLFIFSIIHSGHSILSYITHMPITWEGATVCKAGPYRRGLKWNKLNISILISSQYLDIMFVYASASRIWILYKKWKVCDLNSWFVLSREMCNLIWLSHWWVSIRLLTFSFVFSICLVSLPYNHNAIYCHS